VGWFLFAGVTGATGYYCNAIGWVVFHGAGELLRGFRGTVLGSAAQSAPPVPASSISLASGILPPESGFSGAAFLLQLLMTALVILGATTVLLRGVRRGIEGVSRVFTPLLFLTLILLIFRSLTLPGAGEGLHWFILKFRPQDINGAVAMAAMGQVVFSLALGGTFMVVYGSYLEDGESLAGNALATVVGDTMAGLMAGLAIFPAVFALGREPDSGPGLIFSTLPGVFASFPGGWIFGLLFFLSLGGVAFLSAVAAFEVLIAGLTDNTRLSRKQATLAMAAIVFLLAIPPMINMQIFLPWDLALGSGLQSLGVLLSVVTVGWAMQRGEVLAQVAATGSEDRLPAVLYLWIRWVIPAAILLVGSWWFVTEALPFLTGP
jgi:NSS family neurotransmitter:Na+ symporter